MAHKIYYSISGYDTATIISAGFDASDNSLTVTDSSQVTNEENINSNSITSTVVTSFGNEDAIRIDFGTTKTLDFIAHYMSSADTNDLYIYSSNSSAASYTQLGTILSSAIGWNIKEIDETTNRYWVIRSEDGTFSGLREVLLGKIINLQIPDIGSEEQEDYSTIYQQSYSGTQYSNKIDQPSTLFTLNFSFIDSDLKSDLETMQSTVQNRLKFVYYDESSYHYVRLVSPLQFTQVANSVYSTTMILQEQFQ
tara:strand:+ start:9458 stop:10213 length:756 start_codon:yes stop_codon:yes gene_type:complete